MLAGIFDKTDDGCWSCGKPTRGTCAIGAIHYSRSGEDHEQQSEPGLRNHAVEVMSQSTVVPTELAHF